MTTPSSKGPPNNGTPRIAATYEYRDEQGEYLFECVRFEPKDFRQRHRNGHGGYVWTLNGCRRVPYRLPELLADLTRAVFICEGEKDVENLASISVVATCNPMGAGKWKSEYNEHFRNREVI